MRMLIQCPVTSNAMALVALATSPTAAAPPDRAAEAALAQIGLQLQLVMAYRHREAAATGMRARMTNEAMMLAMPRGRSSFALSLRPSRASAV